jgi:hypothetical protein
MILEASKRLRKFFNSALTDEMIWKEIIEEQKLNNIHQLRRLNKEAARIMIAREKRYELLSLGITELPQDVAQELVKYKGEKLFLNCVTTLPVESAKAIGKFQGMKLMLDGVRELSLPILGRLASYKGIVSMAGIEKLEISDKDSKRAQMVFGNLEFAKLSLSGLKKPSQQLLKALARFPGQLELNCIESLTEKEAEIIGESLAKGLSLKGINILSYDLLKLFTQFTGFLDLSGAQEIRGGFVHIVAARPTNFSLFSGTVKRLVESFKKEEEHKKLEQLRETREIKLKQLQRAHESEKLNRDLLAEFEKFDEIEPIQVEVLGHDDQMEAYDPYSPEIDDKVVNDIETNLNHQINEKKKRVNELLAKGFSNLSIDEKELLQELRNTIDQLKSEIRGALDILIEKKELGSVVFDNSKDLVAYLQESGAQDDEDDLLDNIEDIDMFGGSFDDVEMFGNNGEDGSNEDMVTVTNSGDHSANGKREFMDVEGDDFVISEV